jgi:hypothetical protein
MMTPVQKAWMDWAGYSDMLRALRFSDMSDWSDEAINYFDERMTKEKSRFSDEDRGMISKSVGWQRLTAGPISTFIPEEWAKWKGFESAEEGEY